ncbi:universal stress protein [soil metagenome]
MGDDHERASAPRRGSPLAHVLVATDFTAGAAHAAARAAGLPLAKGARLSILHVLPDRLPQKLRASAEAEARRQLGRVTRAVSKAVSARGRSDLAIASDFCAGQAYVEIIRRARSAGAELIVLGRHGRRPFKDMFLGSTASRVLRAGDVPVLVVSRRPARPYRRPMVAVDLEDTSRAVVDLALRVLAPEVSSAVLAHAYHVPFEGFLTPGARPGDVTELRKEYLGIARSSLVRLIASLGPCGVAWETSVRRGDPRSVILLDAARQRADLLVIGTHGRSGLAHALIGSVAEGIVDSAPLDVLVARPARLSFELP